MYVLQCMCIVYVSMYSLCMYSVYVGMVIWAYGILCVCVSILYVYIYSRYVLYLTALYMNVYIYTEH